MDVELPTPGTYVVAVSGGVDSMVLMDLLHQANVTTGAKPYRLIVAHLDHGIRSESADDRRLVAEAARSRGLPFVYHEAELGDQASEATARQARYQFLHDVRQSSGARAILTAHHQDDVLETAIINMLRGSGRKGLTSLQSRHDVIRPLQRVPKQQLIEHAKNQNITWHEDRTNTDERYLRNYIRVRVLPRFTAVNKSDLLQIITTLQATNAEIDELLSTHLHLQPIGGELDRKQFASLPHAVALEIMAAWLRAHQIRDFDRKTLERLVVGAKVGQSGTLIDVVKGASLVVNADSLALRGTER